MSITVNEIMERIGSTQTMRVIKFIEDCFDEMAMSGAREIKVSKQNIIEGRIRYPIPSEAVNLSSVSVLYQENASELIAEEDRIITNATTNWTNVDYDVFDTTDELFFSCTVAGQYCYLDDDLIEEGKRYRLQYDFSNGATDGAFKLQTHTSADDLGTFEEGTNNILEFTATEDGKLRITGTVAGNATFDNFSLKEMAQDKYREASRLIGKVSPNYFDEET